MNYCVITTIHNPTAAVEKLHSIFDDGLIVVGDKKTPAGWQHKSARFVSIEDQRAFEYVTRYYIPHNHYSRKNLGYLMAMKNRATVIYDTDDDNIPNDNWIVRKQDVEANGSYGKGWYNVYDLVAGTYMWPRGFSLKNLRKFPSLGMKIMRSSPIQQGLADGEPDVDAIWRLVYGRHNTFDKKKSIYLNRGAWCPFNSQTTWFFPIAYPLMYLPISATFRCTDIWRSFIAQRCLWELNLGVTFHSPSEVFQDRNEHDLIQDLKSEVPGYVFNDRIVEILEDLELLKGQENICNNLITCYRAIIAEGILPETEIESVKAWVKDYENIRTNM